MNWEIRTLPADTPSVRRYLTDLWIPYNREMESVIDSFSLADDVDLIETELPFQQDRLEDPDCHAWVVTDTNASEQSIAAIDGELLGFLITEIDSSPPSFDRPDQLRICEIYVKREYRGTNLAEELLEHTRQFAREKNCGGISLRVDVENERAIAFYEKLGFNISRMVMVSDIESE